MKTEIVAVSPEIPPDLASEVQIEVRAALEDIKTQDGNFVINDTIWFGVQNGKASPTVVNSAKFITKKLAAALVARNWEKEKTLEEQTIDGYKTFQTTEGCFVEKADLKEMFDKILENEEASHIDEEFSRRFQSYFRRKCFRPYGLEGFEKFKVCTLPKQVRIGLEFETGNIASSFRAFSKLNSLFSMGMIDVGVFITSKDKASTACRIWPASNRNGSFEELRKRDYRSNIKLPLIEIAFSPDSISKDAPYMASNMTTYVPKPRNIVEMVSGRKYDVYEGETPNKKILKIRVNDLFDC